MEEITPEELQEGLLNQIRQTAKLSEEVLALLREHPAPELETILQLHRILVLKLTAEAQAAPELLKWVGLLMKPLMEFARLEETRKRRELAEQKYRDQQAQECAANKQESDKDKALQPETAQRIEHELHLL